MIKPDYIPFSQEIFDECESLRIRLLENIEFQKTPEFNNQALKLARYIFDDGYGKYLWDLKK